jgi:hypothetical protein
MTQDLPFSRDTVELAPETATGMAVDPKMPKPQPTTIVTTAVRTAVQRGVDLTRAPVGRGHGSRWHRRRRLGRHGLSLTLGTEGLFVKPANGGGSLERLCLGLSGSGRAGEAGAVTARVGQVTGRVMLSGVSTIASCCKARYIERLIVRGVPSRQALFQRERALPEPSQWVSVWSLETLPAASLGAGM